MDLWRRAAGRGRCQALSCGSVAGRRRGAHRVVHRRRRVASAYRLFCAGAATARGERIMIGITALAFFLAAAAQAQSLNDFAYGIPLSTSGDEPFFQVAVPSQVFQGAAHSGAADLRVFNGDGAIVPFAYLPSPITGREKRPPVELPLFPLRADRAQTDL